MASGGKRGASERVLESKHVIGLFLLMLLFSGVFFTLGYVMGRGQYDGQVGASSTTGRPEPVVMAKPEITPKKNAEPTATESPSDPAVLNNPVWDLSKTGNSASTQPRLEPAPKTPVAAAPAKTLNAKTKVPTPPVIVPVQSKGGKNSVNAPLIPSGALVLQVAALVKQDDALSIASSLQKKHYQAYVQTPVKDKYYRVQVGPFKDQKTADTVKKGLESEGFKAFYVKH